MHENQTYSNNRMFSHLHVRDYSISNDEEDEVIWTIWISLGESVSKEKTEEHEEIEDVSPQLRNSSKQKSKNLQLTMWTAIE